jgi:integrase/recombinase XerD
MPLLATNTNDLEVISLWLTNKSKTTRITYTSTVNQFLEFVNRPLPELTLSDLNLWVQRINLTYKDYTVNNKIITIKSLLNFCYKVGYLDSDLSIILKAKCLDTSVNSKCLSAEEVRQLIKGTTNIRDGVLLILIFSLGLRVAL